MAIKLIAVLDMNNGIGDGQGNLLFDLPKDMARFRAVTSNRHIVMGRKTWESLPARPLPKRVNYVATMNPEYEAEGAQILHSIEEIRDLAITRDLYVIGGGELYHQLIDDADELILTHVHVVDFNAKVHFPDFGHKDWELHGDLIKHEPDNNHPHAMTFATYRRKK